MGDLYRIRPTTVTGATPAAITYGLIAADVESFARKYSIHWESSVVSADGGGAFLLLAHPGSAGIAFDLDPKNDVASTVSAIKDALPSNREFLLASAAPPLDHPTLLEGLRTVITAHGLDGLTVRSLAAVLVDNHCLDVAESTWLTSTAE